MHNMGNRDHKGARMLGAPVAAGASTCDGRTHPLPVAWADSIQGDVAWASCDGTAGSSVVLTDGARVRVREVRSDGSELLRRMFLTLSDRTRYLYFCAGVPANETWAGRFAALSQTDGYASYALVAEVGDPSQERNEVIGLARFVRSVQGQSAEIGLLLADAWQSRGLGRFVLDRLQLEARCRAVAAFTGSVLWENQRMMRLARRVFDHLEVACGQGVCELTMALC